MLGATRCLLSCWVPHAGTGWLMWLPWVGDSACNQAPACNHLPLLFIYNFTEGQSCCQSCEHQCWRRGGWVWSRGREDKMGAVPQASPEVFPSDAKNDTSLAGAWGPNCQLQQIVGHCVWQKPLLLSPPLLGGIFQRMLCFPDMQGHTMTLVWRGNKRPFMPH